MEIHIGVSHTPKEITLEVEGTVEDLQKSVAKALAADDGVLWLTDTRGRTVGVPAERIAYVEIENDAGGRKVGFGRA
jgi:hypothetical protein